MSLTSLLESITRRQHERTQTKWSDYRQLVADICDGKEPDADRIANILADNDRSLGELRHDAELLARRRKMRQDFDAIAPLEEEANKVEQAIEQGERALDELIAKHKEKISPWYARRFEIKQVRTMASRARDELRDSCEDRELLAELESRQSDVEEVSSEVGRLEKEIAQNRVWSEGDLREAAITSFDSETKRYQERSEAYDAKIAELEADLEPAKKRLAFLNSQMQLLEQRLLVP